MVNYAELTRSTPHKEVESKSLKVEYYNNNYSQCEPVGTDGYNLVTYNEKGEIVKSQYYKWRSNRNNNNMDYSQFDEAVKAKKAQSKFLSLQIGENADYIFSGMIKTTQMSNFTHEIEDVWVVTLKGIDIPEEKKQWTFGTLKVLEQFIKQNIQEGDKINIEREPMKDKSRYVVTKL